MTERNQRKVYTGRVVSDKMDKTSEFIIPYFLHYQLCRSFMVNV